MNTIDELLNGTAAVHGGRRVVRVTDEHESSALRSGGDGLQIELHVARHRHIFDRRAHGLGHGRALFIARCAQEQRLVGRREGMRHAAEQLRRAAAEQDVLGLALVHPGEDLGHLAGGQAVAGRRPGRVGQHLLHGLDGLRARPERVFIVVQEQPRPVGDGRHRLGRVAGPGPEQPPAGHVVAAGQRAADAGGGEERSSRNRHDDLFSGT
jgi:hypothetical protein